MPFAVKDFRVVCKTFGQSGTPLSFASAVVYQSIPAHSRKTIREFDLGFINSQSATVSLSWRTRILDRK